MMHYKKVNEKEKQIVRNNIWIANETHPRIDYKGVVCKKPWGHEFIVYESDRIGIWFLKLNHGHKTSLHTHFHKDTLLFCISGAAKLTYTDGEEEELNVMDCVYIPKHKFHGIGSFAPETWLLEIEIFDTVATFSDKNDLLRIDDQYKRNTTGYENSVEILKSEDDLEHYEHFMLEDGFSRYIQGVKFEVFEANELNLRGMGHNILLKGSVAMNGSVLKEGSLISEIPHILDHPLVLRLQKIDYEEDAKIIHSLDQLALRTKSEQGNRIVLTSGCFDILHVGHLQHLKMAKEHGDILWVCLSDDAQIKKLKGDARPINNFQDRINLFKTISYVDAIIPYSEEGIEKEETLDSIMKLVNPDVWVKGDDYTREAIYAKHPHLKCVEILPNVRDKSTTNIIKKIIKA
jgi:rfaE bifunctional protein nucleotidyltransferase chain/domain